MNERSYRVQFHIEELVLHGFAAHNRLAIAGAVESELLRLLHEEGLPAGLVEGGALARLASTYTAQPGAHPHAAGAEIARAIYRGLSQSPRPGARDGADGADAPVGENAEQSAGDRIAQGR